LDLGGFVAPLHTGPWPHAPSVPATLRFLQHLLLYRSSFVSKMALRYFSQHRCLKLLHAPKLSQTGFIKSVNNQSLRWLSVSQQRNMSSTDYSNVPTPTSCYVDFCLVPVSPLRPLQQYPYLSPDFSSLDWHWQRLCRKGSRRDPAGAQGERAGVHSALCRDDNWSVIFMSVAANHDV
jgi:hypothetical protein